MNSSLYAMDFIKHYSRGRITKCVNQTKQKNHNSKQVINSGKYDHDLKIWKIQISFLEIR
jgi:hypothetical protein